MTSKLFSSIKNSTKKNFFRETQKARFIQKIFPKKKLQKKVSKNRFFLFSATKKIPSKIKRQGTVMMHNKGLAKFRARQNEKNKKNEAPLQKNKK